MYQLMVWGPVVWIFVIPETERDLGVLGVPDSNSQTTNQPTQTNN